MLEKRERKLSFFLLIVIFLAGPIPGHCNEHAPWSKRLGGQLTELAGNPTWRALLHFDGRRLRITDPNFLLSWPNPTLQRELRATVDALMQPPKPGKKHAQCRFPARFLWIRHNLDLPLRAFPKVDCPEFRQFRQKAPADTISLVFVSENVSSPSSMMGHAFLKLEGKTRDGKISEHSVSYYTVVDSYNLPKLFFESLVTGMPGLYSLTPYRDQKVRYLTVEGRNIWEYHLLLDTFSKDLVFFHVWELKGLHSTYFFDTYNCATVTNFMLAVANPKVLDGNGLWISPIDVVKNAYRAGLVKSATLTPSPRWKIKMLVDQMPATDSDRVYDAVNHSGVVDNIAKMDQSEKILALELYKSYSDYLVDRRPLNNDTIHHLNNSLARMADTSSSETHIDLSAYKTPVKTQSDSQWSAAIGHKGNAQFIEFGFLPAAHRIHDDNRQYFTENALQIMDLRLRYYPERESFDVHKFLLYSVTNINPWDKFTGGWSFQWKTGIERQYDADLRSHHVFNIDGGAGLASVIHHDVSVYAMFGIGYGIGASEQYVYGTPEAGLIVNEIFNMKTQLQARYPFNQLASKRGYLDLRLDHAWYATSNASLTVGFQLRQQRETKELTVNIGLSRYF